MSPIPTFSKLRPDPDFNDIVSKVNTLVGEMTNLILNLDSLNVVSLTADHIDAGTIDASIVTIRSDLTAGAYVQIDGNGLQIYNGSIFTFEADINGEVTATGITLINDLTGTGSVQIDNSGIEVNNGTFDTFTVDLNGAVTMTSALVQSSTATYPRVVMDSSNALFSAETSATEDIQIVAEYFLASAPSVVWTSGAIVTSLGYQPLLGFSLLSGTDISIGTSGDLFINVDTLSLSSSNLVTISNFSQIFSNGAAETLQDALDAKANVGDSTSSVSNHNHGITDGTVLMVDGGGTVTFVASGGHDHTLL